jgi:6-methylsalicylate decarboxylase
VISRRAFLAGLTTLTADALVRSADAQAPISGDRIDVHHHFASPAFIAMMREKQTQGFQVWQSYTPTRAIEDMDRGSVALSLLSITTPGIWFGDRQETKRRARQENEYGARLVADHPRRFGLLAVLPLPDVDASLREIEYAFDSLKAVGVGLLSNWKDKWIGDSSFTPVLDELNRRKAFVYTHGAAPGCCGGSFVPGVPEITVEYNTDVSRAIVSLLTSGTADRTPNVTYALSHGGGTITALAGRVLGAEASAQRLAATPTVNSRLYHLRRFYYDTAISTSPIQMQALKALVGSSQILFGTDYPFGSADPTAAALRQSGLGASELRNIDRNNILRIFPSLIS